jgi:hypothetical protein
MIFNVAGREKISESGIVGEQGDNSTNQSTQTTCKVTLILKILFKLDNNTTEARECNFALSY